MGVRIRLARSGAKKAPYYKIVVADSRSPRDGKFIEKIGTYNPLLAKDHEQRIKINHEKVSNWLSKGAQPSERIKKILINLGLMTQKERNLYTN